MLSAYRIARIRGGFAVEHWRFGCWRRWSMGDALPIGLARIILRDYRAGERP